MILSYHNISLANGFYTISSENFDSQLEWLKHQFQFVDFETYVFRLKQGEDSRKFATLTFDDGFTSFQDFALPVLEKHQIPAINFVPYGLLGKSNEWDNHITDQVFPVLTAAQISKLAAHPLVSFGAHGVSHTSFGRLTPDEMEVELVTSKQELERCIQQPVYYFSFPYGQLMDIPAASMPILHQTGFKAAVSSRLGKNSDRNLLHLYRVAIESFDTLETLQAKVSGKSGILKQWVKEMLWRCKLRGVPGGK